MKGRISATTFGAISKATLCCAFFVWMASALAVRAQQLDSIPDRGFQASGSYALTDIETVNTTNGDLALRVPLGSLPPGRGGNPGFTLQLLYNSKLWDSRTDIAPDPLNPNRTVDVHWLNPSAQGGWRYNLAGYAPVLDNRNSHYDTPCPVTQPCGIYIYKLRVSYPDGSMHDFRPVGYSDGLADGYYSVTPGPNMTYYSTDGTFTRLEYDASGTAWTLYFPDGTRVNNPASGGQRTYDRNDNYTELQFVSNYNNTGHAATKIVDQLGRYIAIESNAPANESYIHVLGVGGVDVVTTIRWKRVYVNKSYNARTHFTYNATLEDLPLTVVDQIILPPQTGGDLRYIFGYNAPSAPSGGTPSYGWGELNSITLPSGAQSAYQYNMDGQNGGAAGPDVTYIEVLKNFPTRKDLNYTLEYDNNSSVAPVQTWLYSTGVTGSTVTGPDGGVTTEWFGNTDPDSSGWDRGLVYKTAFPDGRVVERFWQENRPGIEGIPSNVGVNTYVKREYTSIPNAAGTLVRTAIREFNLDKNGNILRVAEYDWVNYADVARDTSGRPTGIPASATLKRESINTYHVSTPDASVTGNATGTYHYRGSPRLLRSVKSAEEGPSASQRLTRAEFTYDSATTTGNLTQQLMWDSTKGLYSNPLSASNSITLLFQYDAYGNPTLVTDARNVQTQFVYGNISGFTNLYPTETRNAYGTPVQRTQSSEYDFNSGLVTRSTDVDNNVSTSTSYDVFGRPTLTKAAEGKAEEAWTSITYSDVSRRIIARSDLNTLGDGKLVSVKHYDQLGRVRLARQLENATTQAAEDETAGIKVQLRYTISNGYSYQLSSQPYRASASNIATEGPRGWTRTKQDAGGRIVEIKTFRGNALPGPWGGNADGSGTITTSYDAEFTTVTDQSGRVRRKLVDGLGRLVRLDEPDANNNLGSTTSPVQPTYYTYNALSKLTQVSQGSQTRTYQYSSLARLISQTSPETGIVTFTLDAGGNMISRTDANGVTTNYTYDELGRAKTVDYLNTSLSPDIERYYDGATYGKGRFWYNYAGGNYTVGSNVEHFAVDTYDALGRPKVQRRLFKANGVWSSDFRVQRTYDLAGNVRSQTYPSGRTMTYGYDETGRVNDFRGNLGDGVQRVYTTNIVYDEQSRMREERFGTVSPLYHKLHYNWRGQLYDIRLGTVSWSTDQWQWNRGALVFYYSSSLAWDGDPNAPAGADSNGNVLREQHWLSADDAVSSYAYTQDTYGYDSLNRLTSVTEAHGGPSGLSGTDFVQSYDYDRWGNRTINATNSWGGVPEQQFEIEQATNRLYATGDSQRPSQNKLMRYDAAGNLVYDAFTGQGTRAYDQENRLVSAQDIYGQTSTYSYDADGRRVRRNAANEEWWQIYGMAGELVAEYRAGAAPMTATKEYGYHGKEMLVTMSSGDDQRLKRFVTNLYYGALRRDPTAQELQDASNQLTAAGVQGQSQLLQKAKDMTRALFIQTAYETSPFRTDSQYVGDLYYTYLQRAPDDSGLNWWTSNVPTDGRSNVCNGFQESPEFATLVSTLYGAASSDNQRTEQLVNNFYLGAYGRFATPTELQQQRDALNAAAAQGLTQVQAQAETFGRGLFAAQAADLSLPAQQFVTNLYEGFLQRGPDAGGLSFWTAQAGTTVTSRQNVLSSFATCPPFRELSGAIYRETFWLVSDARGTPRMVVDKSGSAASVKRHDYLPFGEELYAGMGGRDTTQGYNQTDNVRQHYAGKERDASTGLDYSINRYYSSAQGRFTTADPAFITLQRLADPQMLNLYAYVRNNPLRYVDPDGLELYVFGPDAQTFVDDLESATGLHLHYDPGTGQVTVIGKVPRRMSRDAQRLYDIIKDKNNVVHMLTIRTALVGNTGRRLIALVGQQNNGGTNKQGQFVSYHIIDYDDVDKFNKPHGSQAPQIALHEVTEAYEAALLQIVGRPTDEQFKRIHNAAIVYENASRARVPGLGQRGSEGPVLDAQGNPVLTPNGNESGYIDYTAYREIYSVDASTLNVIDVKVEKKQQQPPQRKRK